MFSLFYAVFCLFVYEWFYSFLQFDPSKAKQFTDFPLSKKTLKGFKEHYYHFKIYSFHHK